MCENGRVTHVQITAVKNGITTNYCSLVCFVLQNYQGVLFTQTRIKLMLIEEESILLSISLYKRVLQSICILQSISAFHHLLL